MKDEDDKEKRKRPPVREVYGPPVSTTGFIKRKEGYAGMLKKETSYTGLTGKPDSKVKGTSKYGYYYDSGGKLTRLYGDLVKKEPSKKELYKQYTEKEASDKLSKDIDAHTAPLEKAIGSPLNKFLNKDQQAAIKSYYYNVGMKPSWKSVKNLKKAAQASTEEERDSYLKDSIKEMDINTSGGKFIKGLETRRKEERELAQPLPREKQISRGPAGVMMKPEEEEKKKKEIESVSRASLISKIAPELKEEVIANPNINEEQTQQLVKHLSSDKSIKKAADKAVGLQPQSKSPSLVDQFKEALTFFAPQIIGGAIGGVEGYEEAGKLRDSYIDYKQDMAQLALQQTPNVRAAQQSEFLTQSGAPAVFNPKTGKYQDTNGNVVEASSLVSGKDMRQKESLVRADKRIQLSHDKFAMDLQKENQLTGAQQTKLAELDTTILSGGKLQEAFGNVETGPVIGRYNSMLEYFDSATPEATKLKAHATNLRLFYQRAMSGLQVNEKEMEMIANVIPDQNDAPTVFAAKLEVFNELTSLNKQAFLESIKTGQPLKGEVVQELIQKGTQFQGTSAPKRGRMTAEQKSRLEELRSKHRR